MTAVPDVPRECSCGRSYDTAAWLALPKPASGVDRWDDGTVVLVLRNCVCGSTMAAPTLACAVDCVVNIIGRYQRVSLPVVEESEVLRDARDTYGFGAAETRAALAAALLGGDILVYESPRADAPPGTNAYRIDARKRPF